MVTVEISPKNLPEHHPSPKDMVQGTRRIDAGIA
jgi:hypothetical protein